MKDIITTIILGFIGGLTPGPILLIALSEILRSPKKGLVNGGMYIIVAGLTEFFIGLLLVATSSWLKIPHVVFHIFAFVGVVMLAYIALQLYKIRKIDYTKEQKKVGIKHIFLLMIFNGPLWLYWTSVCLPIAFSMGSSIHYGEYLFVAIFEISMVVVITIIFFGFNALRKFLLNERVIRKVFVALAILVFLLALKILYTEIIYFLK